MSNPTPSDVRHNFDIHRVLVNQNTQTGSSHNTFRYYREYDLNVSPASLGRTGEKMYGIADRFRAMLFGNRKGGLSSKARGVRRMIFLTAGWMAVSGTFMMWLGNFGHGTSDKTKLDDHMSRLRCITSGYIVITKTMIGAGILSLSYACARAGLIVGTLLLLFSAVATWSTVYFLAKVGIHCHEPGKPLSFYGVMTKVAPKCVWIVDVSTIVMCFGAGVAYLQIIGDMISGVFLAQNVVGVSGAYWIRQGTQVFVASSMLPLVTAKQISKTQLPNIVGLACLAYICVIACVFSDPGAQQIELAPSSFIGILARLPVFLFAFSCQQNVLAVIEETRADRRTPASFFTLSGMAVGSAVLLCGPVMLLPYLTYGQATANNFLANYPAANPWVLTAFVLAAVAVAVSYPLQMHPFRRSLLALIHKGKEHECPTMEQRWRVGVAVGMSIVTLATAMLCDDLGIVVEISGLLGCNTANFVMPCVLFLMAFRKELSGTAVMVLCKVLLAVLLMLYPVSLTAIVWQKITG